MEVHQNQSKMKTEAIADSSIRVVKGVNHKMNYFVDSIHVTDLADNTPYVCQPEGKSVKEDEGASLDREQINGPNSLVLNYFDNQKKIFKNNSIFLDNERPALITTGISRMDLTFWENIERKGASPNLFEANVSLEKFNKFYGGQSLFHYFVGEPDLIKIVRDKYLMAKNHDKLGPSVRKLPLNAMCPDNEMHSALHHCIQLENLKSFEYIIDLVNDFPGICLTNCMVGFIPLMLNR